MACLDENSVLAFAQGTLSPAACSEIDEHLRTCERCTLLVGEAAKSLYPAQEAPSATGTPHLAAGTLVGRYVIERCVARGGGGTVYEAHDPQLKRKVALKLINIPSIDGQTPDAVQARVLREAETMAKLSHPGVVQAHDAGLYEGQVYIVLEYVEGETLTRWQQRQARSWREIVDAFRAAGEGLASIHEANLAHGDFKPDNVLVARDGRVRITDFGLARPIEGAIEAQASADKAASGHEGLTAAGGTPAFMAPEQREGQVRNVLSDQYSFCVALFLALFGRHPSDDRAPASAGAPSSKPGPEGTRGVPSAVVAVLLRGASREAARRYPSMVALLAALSEAAGPPSQARRRAWRWLYVGAPLGLLAFAAALGRERPAAGEVCGDGRLWHPVEECDDGNQDNGDGCTTLCRRCPQGDPTRLFLPETGHCYTLHRTPVDWPTARTSCLQKGEILATYESSSEAGGVEEAFREMAWIGLYRKTDLGSTRYFWVTGEPLPRDRLTPWVAEQAPVPGSDCVVQLWAPPPPRSFTHSFHWTAAACDERHAFVCEQVDWLIDPLTGHAYRIFFDQQTWQSARTSCERIGAHLATITSQAELDFLKLRMTTGVWIGASDAEREGVFTWVTGEPFGFSAFAHGELKSSVAPKNDCVVLGVERVWHDRKCAASHSFLCEIDGSR